MHAVPMRWFELKFHMHCIFLGRVGLLTALPGYPSSGCTLSPSFLPCPNAGSADALPLDPLTVILWLQTVNVTLSPLPMSVKVMTGITSNVRPLDFRANTSLLEQLHSAQQIK